MPDVKTRAGGAPIASEYLVSADQVTISGDGSTARPLRWASGIVVDDEGVPVADNPHTELNFVGAGVTATDGGGGVATITIPGSSGVPVRDGGTPVATATTIDFTGAGVTATDLGGGVVGVAIPGGIAGIVVDEEGTPIANNPKTTLNFVGAGVTATDGGGGVATITIPSGGTAPREAMFYGLTAGTGNGGANDYAATVAVDAPVPFPRSGPATTSSGIVAGGTNQFVLPVTGIYEVSWAIDFLEASQLVIKLGAVEVPHTCATSGAGTQQNCNSVLISATASDLLSLCNASGNPAALTVQTAGALTHAQAASLRIRLVA